MTQPVETILRTIARNIRDYPDTVLVTNALAADTTDDTLTLDANDASRIEGGQVIESDDFQAVYGVEPMYVLSNNAGTVKVRRNYQSQPSFLLAHNANTYYRVAPRFSLNRVYDAMKEIVTGELWPDVWLPKEGTLTYQGTNEDYSPTPTDIEEVYYVFQRVSGIRCSLRFDWLPRERADNTSYPNGALSVPWTVDTSTIYFAYKAKGTTLFGSTTSDQMDGLTVLGATALLLEMEEVPDEAPSRAAIEQRIAAGSKLRAGQGLMGAFYARLAKERVRLEALIPDHIEYTRGR